MWEIPQGILVYTLYNNITLHAVGYIVPGTWMLLQSLTAL
jgi:hypothetical protein